MSTIADMTNDPLTVEELRRQVNEVLAKYQMTLDDFLKSDIDDLDSVELRDLWLMVKGVLRPVA